MPVSPEQATQTFTLDKTHSAIQFAVRHLMIAKVRGRFTAFSGKIELPKDSDIPSSVDVTIDASSVDTREDQRDAHLRSADFLDAQTFPELVFRSTKVTGTPNEFKIFGNLTIHGTTREVVLSAVFEGRGTDPWGNARVGYEANTIINRKDFGLTWNQVLEAGGVAVGDEVRIELNVEAVAQP
jgi:polyisoprenoid-binding protein YceI